MLDPSIQFVTGLPRSGSTLLMNILGQNPRHHVTPTNDLIDMVASVRNNWMHTVGFRSQGLREVKPRVLRSMCGQIYGFYEEEFEAGKTVFDKSRGWIAYIETLEEILQRPVKVLVTIRDIRAIIASFERIHRQSTMTSHVPRGPAFFDMQSIDGRARQLLSPGAVVGIAANRVRDALERGMGDRLLFVRYNRLVSRPHETLQAVHEALDLPTFDYDFENVEQLTKEDDTVHGMWDLHTIRTGRVSPPSGPPPWEGVIPPRVLEWLSNEYADLNSIANEPSPVPNAGVAEVSPITVMASGTNGI